MNFITEIGEATVINLITVFVWFTISLAGYVFLYRYNSRIVRANDYSKLLKIRNSKKRSSSKKVSIKLPKT